VNNEQQTQQADDPSGPGWRDVMTGGVTQHGDMVHRVWQRAAEFADYEGQT